MELEFIGLSGDYRGMDGTEDLLFRPGDIRVVSEEKGAQMLADFPELFKAVQLGSAKAQDKAEEPAAEEEQAAEPEAEKPAKKKPGRRKK